MGSGNDETGSTSTGARRKRASSDFPQAPAESCHISRTRLRLGRGLPRRFLDEQFLAKRRDCIRHAREIDRVSPCCRVSRDRAALDIEIKFHDLRAPVRLSHAEPHRPENSGHFGRVVPVQFFLGQVAAIHQPFQAI